MRTKKESLNIAPQYVTDISGKKTAVLIDIKTFENILEQLEDRYFGQKAEKALQDDIAAS
ncbi:hypothetical protein A3J41_01535 [candidate division TM6 bacterium RIFCSPHIGHO2_12_FULL_38_8]|nr:MAG: hypothetical protein A3J41_01535 [candidate division TM6 bacterium RIFCSPHIGHO2_12_FULL_38_8]